MWSLKYSLIPNCRIELAALCPLRKLLLLVFTFSSESQAVPDLFMREMSGAWELTSHAMPMHKFFKPALDNWTIQQPGHRLLQGSKSRTKITAVYMALHSARQCFFLRGEIFTVSKHSLERDSMWVSPLWGSAQSAGFNDAWRAWQVLWFLEGTGRTGVKEGVPDMKARRITEC